MGKNIFHVGASGAGQVAKLCNNMALGVIMAVTGESIALGVAHGLDPKVLSQMMAVSTGRSWATEVCNPWPGVLENAPASRGDWRRGVCLRPEKDQLFQEPDHH